MPELPIQPSQMPVKKTVIWEQVQPEKKPDPKPDIWRSFWIGFLIGVEIVIHLYVFVPRLIEAMAFFVGQIIDP